MENNTIAENIKNTQNENKNQQIFIIILITTMSLLFFLNFQNKDLKIENFSQKCDLYKLPISNDIILKNINTNTKIKTQTTPKPINENNMQQKLLNTSLLPIDKQAADFCKQNPIGLGSLKFKNFLSSQYNLFTNTPGLYKKNANVQLRAEIPNPIIPVTKDDNYHIIKKTIENNYKNSLLTDKKFNPKGIILC